MSADIPTQKKLSAPLPIPRCSTKPFDMSPYFKTLKKHTGICSHEGVNVFIQPVVLMYV